MRTGAVLTSVSVSSITTDTSVNGPSSSIHTTRVHGLCTVRVHGPWTKRTRAVSTGSVYRALDCFREARIVARSVCTRTLQPVATCRKSPYLHKPATELTTPSVTDECTSRTYGNLTAFNEINVGLQIFINSRLTN